MQKWIRTCLTGVGLFAWVMTNAYAVAPGFFMGIGAGPATNDANTRNVAAASPPAAPGTLTLAKPKSSQFASNLFLGYKINEYAGFESGFTFFSKIKYSSKLPMANNTSSRIRTVNLLGRGTFPIGNYFDIFGRAGVGVTYLTYSGGLSSTGRNQYKTKYSPVFGVGASYTLNQSWVVDAAINRILIGSVVNNVTDFMISLSYHFVDRYCGQFLCDD